MMAASRRSYPSCVECAALLTRMLIGPVQQPRRRLRDRKILLDGDDANPDPAQLNGEGVWISGVGAPWKGLVVGIPMTEGNVGSTRCQGAANRGPDPPQPGRAGDQRYPASQINAGFAYHYALPATRLAI